MPDTTIRDLASGAAIQDGDLFISRQGADTSDVSVTALQIKAYAGAAASVAWGEITGTLSDQTDLQNALDAKQATGNYITALTGDITASGPGSVAATLATVNSNVGSFTNASITVNAKGLITAASSGTAPITDHNSLSGLQGGTTSEYYHLTSAEYTGTGTGVFVRKDAAALTGNVTLAGTEVVTSTATSAFSVGPNGDTNPALRINNSQASANTGWEITAGAATRTAITVISPNTHENGDIFAKGNAALRVGSTGSGGTFNVRLGTTNYVTVTSSATSITPPITTGTWNASVIAGQYGGTGVANTGKTITIGGNFVTSGAFSTTLTVTANTNVTLPTTGTLATLAGSEALTNKSVNGVTLTTAGSATDFLNAAGNYVAAGGGGTPGGSDLELQYNNAGSFGGMAGTAWASTNRTLNWTTATVTASDPIMDLAQTWNAGGVTFTGLKFNVTNIASAAASLLIDIQAGAATKFAVGTTGVTQALRYTNLGAASSGGLEFTSGYTRLLGYDGKASISVALSTGIPLMLYGLGFGANYFTPDTYIDRDASGALAQRASTTSQSFRVYKTFTDASNYERLALNGTATSGWLQLAAETAGTGGDNLNLALTPTGTGALSAHVPDSTAAGGNARGASSTDWQTVRSAATQVASGTQSTIAGGSGNTASGAYSFIVGYQNTATNNASIAIGYQNSVTGQVGQAIGRGHTVSGENAFAGNAYNTASGTASWALGQQATTRGLIGAGAYSSGNRSSVGDAQVILQPVRGTTTNATPVSLATNGTPAATTVMVLPASSVLMVTGIIAARDSSGNAAGWIAQALFKRDGSNNTTRLGPATITVIGTPDSALATAAIDLVANDTLESAEIQVTGVAATTIYWVGELKCVQVL